jgi:hypothetical protein
MPTPKDILAVPKHLVVAMIVGAARAVKLFAAWAATGQLLTVRMVQPAAVVVETQETMAEPVLVAAAVVD